MMPGFHFPVVQSYTSHILPTDQTGQRPSEVPVLVLFDEKGSICRVIQGSQRIVKYVSTTYSSTEKPSLYETCEDAVKITEMEEKYDKGLGIHARTFAYYEMLYVNKWSSLGQWAMLGPWNPVGFMEKAGWVVISPVMGRLMAGFFGLDQEKGRVAYATAREVFEEASKGM